MSRRTSTVKIKLAKSTTLARSRRREWTTLGAVDLHFHGAFGVDLMSAEADDLDHLSARLQKQGVAGFCPTTLSASPPELLRTVERLGRWISKKNHPGAKPLGIHLEGPFISPGACGAHPPSQIRPFLWTELEKLWNASQNTLKIITLAPELLTNPQLTRLVRWSQDRGILLSLGHSQSTESEALNAFNHGFRGVTHAWNAMPHHHRYPGVLGAALGRPDVYVEVILDQIHVAPTMIRWTLALHPSQAICFISDAAPAAVTRGSWCSFGRLKVRYHNGACRVSHGHLAGGGRLLPDAYLRWLHAEAIARKVPLTELFQKTIHHLTSTPLRILGLPMGTLGDRRVTWRLQPSGAIRMIP